MEMTVCDADRKTPLTPHGRRQSPWGWPRVYSPEAFVAVESYLAELSVAAEMARVVFNDRRDRARALFHLEYPEGLLPDEAGAADDES